MSRHAWRGAGATATAALALALTGCTQVGQDASISDAVDAIEAAVPGQIICEHWFWEYGITPEPYRTYLVVKGSDNVGAVIDALEAEGYVIDVEPSGTSTVLRSDDVYLYVGRGEQDEYEYVDAGGRCDVPAEGVVAVGFVPLH